MTRCCILKNKTNLKNSKKYSLWIFPFAKEVLARESLPLTLSMSGEFYSKRIFTFISRSTVHTAAFPALTLEYETPHGNTEHYTNEGTVHHKGRTAITDKRQRHAYHWHKTYHHAYVHYDLPEEIKEYPCR